MRDAPDTPAPPETAEALIARARPRIAAGHMSGDIFLDAEGARLFALPDALRHRAEAAFAAGDADALSALGLTAPANVAPRLSEAQPVRALALTVAQACNLACTYCYASGGDFGGPSRVMPRDIARRAVARLIADTPPGGAVKIAFMGGEPLIARRLVREITEFARARAAARAVSVGFSMTTNATLLTPEDADFLGAHRFALTVSLDGVGRTNDRLRPMRDGSGSFDAVAARLGPVVCDPRIASGARVTVTPDNLDLAATLAGLSGLGFRSIGVSPLLSSSTGKGEMQRADFERLLAAMTGVGRDWLEATIAGRHHPFANLATALTELHRGQPRAQGCGAARDYLAVDADGAYSACHRFVNDASGALGDLDGGVDETARSAWVSARHVDRQDPCGTCWARRLCGGGCHHEVIHRGRPACDYIRGWLTFAIDAYARLMAERPGWFDGR